jgi:hypothetical protein
MNMTDEDFNNITDYLKDSQLVLVYLFGREKVDAYFEEIKAMRKQLKEMDSKFNK